MSLRQRFSRVAAPALALVLTAGAVLLHAVSGSLPTGSSTHFAGSGLCAACHSAGEAGTIVLRNADGHDIAPPTHWRSTMMAQAARDPYWRAQVAAEVAEFPDLQSVIEDKCTTCHAPMGRYGAVLGGAGGFSMAEAMADPLSLDAVSCTVCHQVRDDGLGTDARFSGTFSIGTGGIAYGPYPDPSAGPMKNVSGFDAAYGPHLSGSALCAVCHTLFTPFVHADGSVGGAFPEQTPYLEWLNSVYPEDDVQCQSCHMPEETESVILSTIPPGTLPLRAPFSRHEFVGGNRKMLQVLRTQHDALAATADPVHFDSTIARTERQLASAARLAVDWRAEFDSLVIDVDVENLAGHKLPTGFPSRGLWIELKVTGGDGVPRFHSGAFDPSTGAVAGLDDGFEPHHAVIRSGDQVQVYQSVMLDDFGEVTTTLLRGASYGKDNRIPPRGYVLNGPNTVITAPVGVESDPDFNRVGGEEGSGSDHVEYRVGGLGGGIFTVSVRLLYHPLMPSFVDELLEREIAEVDAFADMLAAEDPAPEVLASAVFDVMLSGVHGEQAPDVPGDEVALRVYPNPASGPVTVELAGSARGPVLVFDAAGRRVRTLEASSRVVWDLIDASGRPVPAGTYFVRVESPSGTRGARVVVIR